MAGESAAANRQLYLVAYSQARHRGLGREDAQDCAMEFVQRLVKLSPRPAGLDSPAWVMRCAQNHAISFARSLQRRRKHEQAAAPTPPVATPGPGPKTLALRRELWQQLFAVLKQLTPLQRELFVRYHIRQQSIAHIAARCNKSPHAVAEGLSHARQRLAVLLRDAGWTEADARALFQSAPRPSSPL